MIAEAKSAGYTFPYVHDADQTVAKSFKAACTPDFFVFAQGRGLVYRGQLDESRPVKEGPAIPVDNSYSGNVSAHARIMTDLMTLAFQCDQTRIISFMLANAGSNRRFDDLLDYQGQPLSGQHHELSHHQSNLENQAKLSLINTWEVQQLAYLLESLDGVETPDGQTLLDHTLVFFSSEIEDGDAHRHRNLPIVLAGGGATGDITPGRHVVYNGEPIANLFISMLNAACINVSTFGMDGTGPLAGLNG
jgi:hypothetical protein